MPVHSSKSKVESSDASVRYLYGLYLRYCIVEEIDSNRRYISRLVDFRPHYAVLDPNKIVSTAFKVKPSDFRRTINSVITISTPPSANNGQDRLYPERLLWDVALDNELDQIDKLGAIEWLDMATPPRPQKAIPLTRVYRYKGNDQGVITERKARTCAVI